MSERQELKELRRREIWLSDILTMSRAQRRKRGIRLERYKIELELGAVRHAIKHLEAEERAVNVMASGKVEVTSS